MIAAIQAAYAKLIRFVHLLRSFTQQAAVWLFLDTWKPSSAFLVPFALSYIASRLWSDADLAMRVSGVVLQLLGLSVVGSQLFRAQQAFRMDKQSVLEAGWAAVKKWAHSRPHWRDDVRLRVQNAHMAITGSADMQLDAFVYPAAGAGAEAWILALKRRLEEVVQRVDKLSLAHASALQELKDELRHEGDKRAADFEEILRRVDDSVFGGLAWQLIGGVFWVGVGVVLSAFPCVAGRLFGATCGASG